MVWVGSYIFKLDVIKESAMALSDADVQKQVFVSLGFLMLASS